TLTFASTCLRMPSISGGSRVPCGGVNAGGTMVAPGREMDFAVVGCGAVNVPGGVGGRAMPFGVLGWGMVNVPDGIRQVSDSDRPGLAMDGVTRGDSPVLRLRRGTVSAA